MRDDWAQSIGWARAQEAIDKAHETIERVENPKVIFVMIIREKERINCLKVFDEFSKGVEELEICGYEEKEKIGDVTHFHIPENQVVKASITKRIVF